MRLDISNSEIIAMRDYSMSTGAIARSLEISLDETARD
jgi:hypothetical protein